MALDLSALMGAIPEVFSLYTIVFVMFGVLLGITVGAIPGLGPGLAIALVLPFSFILPLGPLMGMLIGTYKAGTYGGSISAINFATPGTGGGAAALPDGYGLTLQGKGRKALEMDLYASVIGGIFSTLVLMFLVVPIGQAAPRFGPAELTALYMLALSLIVVFSTQNPGKGFLAAGVGFFLSIVGRDVVTGALRFTFGMRQLQGGIPLVPVLMGFFAIPVIVKQIHALITDPEGAGKLGDGTTNLDTKKQEGLTLKELKSCTRSISIGCVLGSLLGALPGPGASLAAYTSHTVDNQLSKDPMHGKGSLEGVAAAEAGNNATTGATFIPMLTFGIPGSSIAALLMAALVMEGVPVGPRVVVDHIQVVYTLFLLMFVANIFTLIEGKLLIPVFTKLTDIPAIYLWSIIAMFVVIGTYAVNNIAFYTVIALGAGVIGYFFKWFKVPDGPFILAFLVAPLFERSFRQALILSRGDYRYFFGSGIAITLWAITITAILWFVIKRKKPLQKMEGKKG